MDERMEEYINSPGMTAPRRIGIATRIVRLVGASAEFTRESLAINGASVVLEV